jgi:SsrA-binding protein
MPEHVKSVATNRKAGFEYFLYERFEAGLALKGSEIKSIRAGQISLAEAYVRVDDVRGAYLMEAHIAPYIQANRYNHDPKRARRLLLHKKRDSRIMGCRPSKRGDDRPDSRLSQGWTRQARNRDRQGQEIA